SLKSSRSICSRHARVLRLPAHVGFVPNDLLASNLQNRLVGKHGADPPLVDHPHDGDPTTNDRHAVAPFQDSLPTLESLFPHLDEVIQSCLFVSRTASPQGEIASRAGDKNICTVRMSVSSRDWIAASVNGRVSAVKQKLLG